MPRSSRYLAASAQLPDLLRPETWRSEEQPEAPGTIRQLKSRAELLRPRYAADAVAQSDAQSTAVVIEHSVLIIRQMRQVHEQIPEIIRRIEHGDGHPAFDPQGMGGVGGGMGGGMGGFGGGFM